MVAVKSNLVGVGVELGRDFARVAQVCSRACSLAHRIWAGVGVGWGGSALDVGQ